MPNLPTANEPDSSEELLALAEQLQQQVEQLNEQVKRLSEQLGASEAARIAAESRTLQLAAIVEASAEDLQLFGGNWFKPSQVNSITRDSTAGVCLNGTPLGSAPTGENDPVARQMQRLAEEINRQNAARREKASRSSG